MHALAYKSRYPAWTCLGWQITGLRQQFGGTLCQRFRAGESTCAQARPP